MGNLNLPDELMIWLMDQEGEYIVLITTAVL